MPPRKNRKAAKPRVAAAKKVMAKVHKKQMKSNSDTFAITVKSIAQIVPVQGVSVANYIYTTIPLMSSALNVGVTQNAEFNLYKNMYDQVRINGLTIRVTPKANVFDAINGNAENMTQSGDGLIHTVIDRDGPSTTNIQVMSRYPSYKKYSVLKPFGRSYSIKWPTGIWLDTSNLYESPDLLKQVGAFGGVYLYAENLLEDVLEVFNEPYGDIHVWYNVVFRGKTQGALSYDAETGGVTVRAVDSLPLLSPTPLLNVRGSIADTLTTQTTDLEDNKLGETPITDTFVPND